MGFVRQRDIRKKQREIAEVNRDILKLESRPTNSRIIDELGIIRCELSTKEKELIKMQLEYKKYEEFFSEMR
ncbi:MAG: hypothetical protein M0R51_10020 [Clostridia bacterium]|jgi:ribosomal protein S17E|nr:hypothetical protein [Clostridia bacterium]